jgi:wyosine [tRNA(Phe)-imidazoG37] synthetase (radical SAM superfamily)
MTTAKNYHELVSEMAYGPVPSRRFGETLGVNLLPSHRKLCSFNCVYCQLGWSEDKASLNTATFPAAEDVLKAVGEKCKSKEWKTGSPSYIVISGNGEPTLHPEFGSIVKALKKLRDENYPETKLISFTNGSRMDLSSVFEGLACLDECHFKLDAGFERVDLPFEPERFQNALTLAKELPNLVIQACFFTGKLSNADSRDVDHWIDVVLQLNPRHVDLYTVSRGTAIVGLLPVSSMDLNEIGNRLQERGFDRFQIVD